MGLSFTTGGPFAPRLEGAPTAPGRSVYSSAGRPTSIRELGEELT